MNHYEEIKAICINNGYSEEAADIATKIAETIEAIRRSPGNARELKEVGAYINNITVSKAYETALKQADELVKAIESVLKGYIIDSGFNDIKVELKAKYVALINQYTQQATYFHEYKIAKEMSAAVAALMGTVPVEKTIKRFRGMSAANEVESTVRNHLTAIEESTKDSLSEKICTVLADALGDLLDALETVESDDERNLDEELETVLNEHHREVVTQMVNRHLQQKKANIDSIIRVLSLSPYADLTTMQELITKHSEEAVQLIEEQVKALCAPTYDAWAADKAAADLAAMNADHIICNWYRQILSAAQADEFSALIRAMPAVDQEHLKAKANRESLNQLFSFYKRLKEICFTEIMDKDLDTIITQRHRDIEIGKEVQHFYKQLPAGVLAAAERSTTQEAFVLALTRSDSVPTNGTLSKLPRLTRDVMSLTLLANLYEQQQSARAAYQASIAARGSVAMFLPSNDYEEKQELPSTKQKPH